MRWENVCYGKLKWRLSTLGNAALPVQATSASVSWPHMERLGGPRKQTFCVGCLGLCSGRQNHRRVTRARKGLSIGLGPEHPKVYLWKLVRRLLARPVQPMSWVSYSGNLKTALCPALPLRQRGSREKAQESSGTQPGPAVCASPGSSLEVQTLILTGSHIIHAHM